jgi:UDP-N-acetylmuramoyl-tripeptide--D-alanyl-D-alanine ligase
LAIVKSKKLSNLIPQSSKIALVRSPEKTLIKAAEISMHRYKGCVIGITGSNGKTTTKNILHSGINNSFATFKNYNNEIGLPLCALSLNTKQQIAVFEMGAAKKGDIDFLSSIVKPNIGIITNVGHSHLAGLDSLSGVLKVKSELLNHIKKGGVAILPDGDHMTHWKNIRDDLRFYTFGFKSSASFFPSRIKMNQKGTSFFIESEYLSKRFQIKTPLLGNHNILNILASFAAVYESKSNIKFFLESLKRFKNSSGRLELRPWISGSKLINDSYNANPDSMKAAIEVISQFNTKGKKILVIGDMKELGRFRKKLHKEIGDYAKMYGIDMLIGFGDLTRHTVNSFGDKGFFFESKDGLANFLFSKISKGDTVLLKGSRAMGMEELIGWPF